MQYNKFGGGERDEILFTKNEMCVQTGSIEIYAFFSLVRGNIFIHYW
jgi:hypothetical protein